MTKKAYMKPSMKVVELQHKYQILTASPGVNNTLQDGPVTTGW